MKRSNDKCRLSARCAVFLLAAAFSLCAQAQEESSSWIRTGEMTWRNRNPGKAFRDARLTGKDEILLGVDSSRFDPARPLRFEIHPAVGSLRIEAFDRNGEKVPFKLETGGAHVEVRAGEAEYRRFDGVSVAIAARSEETALARVMVKFDPNEPVREVEMFFTPAGAKARTNLSPTISQPKHADGVKRLPEVAKTEEGFVMRNSSLEARFSVKEGLRLVSLRNEYAGRELLLDPSQTGFFLVDTGNGRASSARDWSVKGVDLSPARNSARVTLEGSGLEAVVTLSVDAEELRTDLEITNTSTEAKQWKTVFPQIGGLAVSEKWDDDYYLFPYYGGLVQNANSNLRLFYGGNEAWWQMVDLFSPAEGTGVSLRCLDEGGRIKGIAFRKGKSNPAFTTHVSNLYKRLPEGSFWPQSLPGGNGSSFGFEYCRYERAPGKSFVYPGAVIAMHPGDWHEPMQVYADWAHKVWKWRPIHTRLDQVWDIETVMASTFTEKNHQKRLYNFATGEWYSAYREDGLDMGEFRHWWKWSDKGPFGVDLSKGKEAVLRQMHNRWSYFFMKDPATGNLLSTVNDGDYDYNPIMGGLEGLRKGIETAHDKGALVQFYTDPFIVDSTTRMGQTYGRRFSVVNPSIAPTPGLLPESPRDGHVVTYAKWGMCPDNPEYQEIYAKNMARLVRETGVDAIRMDQFGFTGMTCFSTEHPHEHAEPGEHVVLRGMKSLAEKVRAACEAENPAILLTAEYPGADYLAGQLDGALTYEISFWSRSGLRPLPTNLFRFYFPELKYYDNPAGNKSPNLQEICLWNGVGLFQRIWTPVYDRILKENGDAFRSPTVKPLVPTLAKFVYANRFEADGKQLTVVYNARETAFDGPVLAAEADPRFHYFDLLNGKELSTEDGSLHIRIEPDKVAAVVRLPRAIRATREGEGWKVELPRAASDGVVVFCDGEGAPLKRVEVGAGEAGVTAPSGLAARQVKLLRGHFLVDAVSLPEAGPQ